MRRLAQTLGVIKLRWLTQSLTEMLQTFYFALLSIPLLFTAKAVVAQSALNKCLIDGKTVYQQTACPGTGETVRDSVERARRADEAAAESLRRQTDERRLRQERMDARSLSTLSPVERLDREQRESQRKIKESEQKIADGTHAREFQAELDKYCAGRAYEKLVIGMTEDQMLHCSVYRKPDSINVSTYAHGNTKQYVFRIYGSISKPTYVYFRNGKLSAIQE